jgi:hypothetical protein
MEQVAEVGHLFKSTTKDVERPQGELHELEFCNFQNFASAEVRAVMQTGMSYTACTHKVEK